MNSFMLKRFAAYGMLCRLGGCFFIKDLRRNTLEKARVSWKSPYLLYSASCLTSIITFQVTYIMKRVEVFNNISQTFSRMLLIILQTIITLKIGINFASMTTGSAKLLEFFRKSATFEKSTGFPACKGSWTTVCTSPWSLLRRLFFTVALINSYVITMHFFVGGLANNLPPEWILAGKIFGCIAGLFFFLYDSLPYVVLRCCSSVLVEYIRAQLITFERCNESNVFRLESQTTLQLEAIRCNLGFVKELKDSLNAAWKCPLAAMSTSIIFLVCVVFYSMFQGGAYKEQIWIALSYCVYSSLSFVEIACVSQALMDEAQKLKDTTKRVPTSHATDDYARQLRYLHDSIEPKAMCLSGGGFFRLNKSLLVSMAGAMITYTVILVQTNDGLSHKIDYSNASMVGGIVVREPL